MELDQLTMAMHLRINTTALLPGSPLPLSGHKSLTLWHVHIYRFGKPALAATTVNLQPVASRAKDENSYK